uniref:PB1 domain-containing protein n=1 Tax=Angiostrongylus cantonensis TaxID=6313 RepID=A0A0K0DRU8_ANGCA
MEEPMYLLPFHVPTLEDIPESTTEPRTVCFRLFRGDVSHFAIEYTDKDDLYRSLMKKLDELNIPCRKMYFVDDGGGFSDINNPHTVLGLALDNDCVIINVCPEDYNSDSCPDDTQLDHEITEGKRETKSQKCSQAKNCGCPPARHPWVGRSHSRDHFYYPHRSCGCHWYSIGFYHEPSPYSQSFYGHVPHAYVHYPPPFSPFMPFHHRADSRLQHCPFFGTRLARGNHLFNGWQDGCYDY